MLARGLTMGAGLLLAVLVGVGVSTDYSTYVVAAAAGLLWVVVTASRPQPMALLAVGIAMFPPAQHSGPLAYGILAATLLGVTLRHTSRLADWRVGAFVAFGGLLVASHLYNPVTHIVEPSEAKNHLIATLLAASAVLTVTIARPGVRATLCTLALAGCASSIYVLTSGTATSSGRFGTDLLNANATGHIGAIAAICAIAARDLTKKVRWAVVAIAPLLLTLYSQSRGGFVIVGLGVALLWALRRSGASRALLLIAVPAAAWALWPLAQRLAGLFFYRRDLGIAESQSRLDVLRLAARLAVDHPLLGIGWRGFPDRSIWELGATLNAHDEFARVAAESGLVALALLLAVVLSAVRGRLPVPAKAALIASLAAFALGNTMSNLAIAVPIWALIGLGLAARHAGAPEPEPVEETRRSPRSGSAPVRRRS